VGERLITLTLIALAAYRVAHLVSLEDGPFNAALLLRVWARQRLNTELSPGVEAEHWVTRGLHCPLCVSFWLTLPAGLLAPVAWQFPLWWLACAGLVLVMHKAVDK
jgi:hypothetical protein